MAQNIPRGTPARILLIFTLLTAVVVVSAWRDALRRDPAAEIRHPTALGDPGFFRRGQPPVRIPVAGRLIELREDPGPAVARADDRMFRIPVPPDSPFSLFSDREIPEGGIPDGGEEPVIYARCAPGQYVRMIPAIAGDTAAPEPAAGPSESAQESAGPEGPPAEARGPDQDLRRSL